jgi:hypothetical protein
LFDKWVDHVYYLAEAGVDPGNLDDMVNNYVINSNFYNKESDFPKKRESFRSERSYQKACDEWWAGIIEESYCHNERYAMV